MEKVYHTAEGHAAAIAAANCVLPQIVSHSGDINFSITIYNPLSILPAPPTSHDGAPNDSPSSARVQHEPGLL